MCELLTHFMFILRAIISAEIKLKVVYLWLQQDAVSSWLVRSSLDRAVRVQPPSGDITLCSWARHWLTLTSFCTQKSLTVPLSTQVYKWVLANLMGRVTLRWTSIGSKEERKTIPKWTQNSPKIYKTLHYIESHLSLVWFCVNFRYFLPFLKNQR